MSTDLVEGFILWREKPYAVKIGAQYLAGDAVAWSNTCKAVAQMDKEASLEDGDIAFAEECAVTISALEAWQSDYRTSGLASTPELIHFWRRTNLFPLVVESVNFETYIEELILICAKEHLPYLLEPQFFLDANMEKPTLYGTEAISSALRHTGGFLRNQLVSPEYILRLMRKNVSLEAFSR